VFFGLNSVEKMGGGGIIFFDIKLDYNNTLSILYSFVVCGLLRYKSVREYGGCMGGGCIQ